MAIFSIQNTGTKRNWVAIRKRVKTLYETGGYIPDIAKKLSIGKTTTYRIVREKGIYTKRKRRAPIHKDPNHPAANHFAFAKITDDTAYWVGFLLTDGNCCANRISVSVAIKDVGHLVKLKNFMEATRKIEMRDARPNKTIQSGKTGRLTVYSRHITADLAKYGVVPNKSKTAKIVHLDNNRHTFRGVIDGDGCVCNINRKGRFRPTISLVGSEFLLHQFRTFALKHAPEIYAKVLPCKNKNLFQFQISGKPAIKLMKILYEDASTYLDRKYEKAMKILKEHHMSV